MHYLNDILCLDYAEIVPLVIEKKDTYQKLRQRGKIMVHGIGGNGRQVSIEYESMPEKYRAKVRDVYGDPYEYVLKAPLLNCLEWDAKAHKYYMNYVLPNGDKLPASDTDVRGKAQINYVHRYTENATWLNMLNRLTKDKRALKRELNISLATFWITAAELIRMKQVALPSNPRRLKDKLRVYQNEGYEALIETHKFGNSFSAKVADEAAEALLKELLAHRNKLDDVMIADAYNRWAKESGREEISPGTVGYRRKLWESELMLEREGLGKTASKLSKQILRDRPTAPLLLVNSDDNVLDAYFKAPGNDWYRPVLYVVMDAYNDYPLGYAWGDKVTKELVKEAYRDAARHVKQITGDHYCWQQIQTDRWAISGKNTTELEAFYNSMATFTPAALKNAQSKYIERAFGTDWHKLLKQLFLHNYSGHNVTSKTKLNTDKLLTRLFPDVSEAGRMIEGFMQALRHTPRKGQAVSRQEEWIAAFQAAEKSRAKLLRKEEYLTIFGTPHTYTNRIQANGLQVTLDGQKMVYELSQELIYAHIGKQVQVHYDPTDFNTVLISDGRGLRFTASTYQKVPSAFADYKPGDADRIKALQEEKRTLMPRLQQGIDERKEILERYRIDAESRLQAGVLVKEISHNDQRVLTQNTREEGGLRAKNGKENKAKYPENQPNIYDLM